MRRTCELAIRTLVLLLLSALLAGCRAKAAKVAAPPLARPDPRVAEYLSQGDAHFLKYHLHGWRQAEAAYRQAYELHKDDAIRDKLLLTRFLIMSRQLDEDIPDPRLEETVNELCANPATERARLICVLGRRYGKGIWLKPADGQAAAKIRLAAGILDPEASAVDAYLYSIGIRAELIENPPEKPESLFEPYKESPLFIYLDLAKRGAQKLSEVEKTVPQFAELYDYMGEELFQKRRYTGARTYFRKAIELIPDYTRPLNGLGNVYNYAIEEYEKAIEYYDAALKYDPKNTAAHFGRGVALHNLGRHEESNAALDSMFRTDISRRGYASASNVRYFKGEACHLQAYNHYLMKNPARARELVEQAKTFLPDSEEINYLSGLLYFEEKNMEAARMDFLRVIQRGSTNCSAQRYLGMIYHDRKGVIDKEDVTDTRVPPGPEFDRLRKMMAERAPDKVPGERRALNYFLGSCACMDRAVRALGEQIRAVPSLDLEETEKVVLRGKLEKKLFDFRLSSDYFIESMIQTVAEDEIEGKQVYVNLMNEIRSRVQLPASGK